MYGPFTSHLRSYSTWPEASSLPSPLFPWLLRRGRAHCISYFDLTVEMACSFRLCASGRPAVPLRPRWPLHGLHGPQPPRTGHEAWSSTPCWPSPSSLPCPLSALRLTPPFPPKARVVSHVGRCAEQPYLFGRRVGVGVEVRA